MKQILVASVSRHVDAREVIRNTKNVFTNGKLCLRSLVAIYNGLTTSVGEGRAMGVIYFCKAFEVSHTTFLSLNGRDMAFMDGI